MKRSILLSVLSLGVLESVLRGEESAQPFGPEWPRLDSWSTGEWWNWQPANPNAKSGYQSKQPFPLDVPREQVVAFAIYTHDRGVLKITGQLYPLKPGEPREARLELELNGVWKEVARTPVVYPGWSVHFRLEKWEATRDVKYRVRHGERAEFAGVLRRDPVEKEVLTIANMSCNSSATTGPRAEMVANLRAQDPDLLFFAGDQTYRHTEHTVGWLEWGLQFRDVLRDRPTITMPDDHDVGHPNLWGEGGVRTKMPTGADGGYYFPAAYVNMVQRQQTWHLPDAVDPAPVEQGITVYFTRLRLGGLDFAILEDRKWKTGPKGEIPQMGPRPDHITDESYDRKSIDKPGLELLGARQMKWLDAWTQDWTGAELKCVLSQTAFCGAVHMHGGADDRLLVDLDCNGWPQSGRNAALKVIRRAWAPHFCGDQHLAVVVKHGIDSFGDGPWSFTSPALVNTIYGRWWHPLDEKPGANPVAGSPLPWTGDFLDGLGNRMSMVAYANPPEIKDEKQRGDGYGIVRINKKEKTMVFECWPRFSKVADGDKAQFPGWPVKARFEDNDGRKVVGHLPELVFAGHDSPVVQVIEEATGEVLYTVRATGGKFRPRVYSDAPHTVKTGRDRPDGPVLPGLKPGSGESVSVTIP